MARWSLPPHRRRSSSDRDPDTAPFQRHTGSRGPHCGTDPKADPAAWTPLMGFIDSPLPALSLRPLPSGPSPRLRPGTATFRTRSVLAVPPGSNGFLRRGPVRRPDPGQPAGLLHPAAGLGVHHVSDSLVGLSAPRDPKVVDPKVRRIILCGGYPSKLSPPRQPDHAVTAPHPFGCARVHRLACPPAVPSRARLRVATLRCSTSRPQGLVPPRSPLRLHDVAVVHRSMLPWALDQHVPMLPRGILRRATLRS